MIELTLIGITWLITMLYYTGRFKKIIGESNLIKANCFGCSRQMILGQESIRAVNYCNSCK
jgi:hypothetical protein